MHADLIFPDNTFYTDIWLMNMDYSVWIFNWIPDMHSSLSAIRIWSRSRLEQVSEILSNCHLWGCPTYFLEPNF